MNFNDPKIKKQVKNLQQKEIKKQIKNDSSKNKKNSSTEKAFAIGPYNTPSGFPETDKEQTTSGFPEKIINQINAKKTSENTLLNKIGSSIKKYIPFKKFMKENYCYYNIQQ
jgi:hypothetical protein